MVLEVNFMQYTTIRVCLTCKHEQEEIITLDNKDSKNIVLLDDFFCKNCNDKRFGVLVSARRDK